MQYTTTQYKQQNKNKKKPQNLNKKKPPLLEYSQKSLLMSPQLRTLAIDPRPIIIANHRLQYRDALPT